MLFSFLSYVIAGPAPLVTLSSKLSGVVVVTFIVAPVSSGPASLDASFFENVTSAVIGLFVIVIPTPLGSSINSLSTLTVTMSAVLSSETTTVYT